MSTTLAGFFAQMRPFLAGQQGLGPTRDALGASPSGDEAFVFYRVLAERNRVQIMRQLYAPLHTLVVRDEADGTVAPGRWAAMTREQIAAHARPAGRHPNDFGEGFSARLAARREREPDQPALYEEIADFCWIRMQAARAPDDEGDGFDRRLYVRQYGWHVPEFVAALERDPTTPRPEPRPVVLLVYRHARSLQTRVFHPSAAGLVALARRQGVEVPSALQAVPAAHVHAAEAQLVEHGVLVPR